MLPGHALSLRMNTLVAVALKVNVTQTRRANA
jgi:hypothetical protein